MKTLHCLAALFTLTACSTNPTISDTGEYQPNNTLARRLRANERTQPNYAASYSPRYQPQPKADVIRSRAAAPEGVSQIGYDALLGNYEYPFPVRNFSLRTEGQNLQMAYMDETGASPNGKTIVLLHGANFTSAYWRRTIQSLSAQGYRVIAPDQIGFGKSSKPIQYQFSFNTLASNTEKLLRFLNISKVTILGHSMGGMLAVRFAINYPQLVEKLILVNPLGLEDWQLHVPYESIDEAYHRELTTSVDDIKNYMRNNYFGGVWTEAYNENLAPLAGWLNGSDSRLIAWDRALISDMIFTQPIVQELPQIQVPTLLVIGQRDRTAIGKDRANAVEAAMLGNYPALGKSAAKAIPHSQLVEILTAGHLPQVDNFATYIQAVVNFLGKE